MARGRKRTELRRDTVDIEIQSPREKDFATVIENFLAAVKQGVSDGSYARFAVEIQIGDHGFQFIRSTRGVSIRD